MDTLNSLLPYAVGLELISLLEFDFNILPVSQSNVQIIKVGCGVNEKA